MSYEESSLATPSFQTTGEQDQGLKSLIRMIEEIHATTVRGMPASAELREAAQRVVEIRYKEGASWNDLSEAIFNLANVVAAANAADDLINECRNAPMGEVTS